MADYCPMGEPQRDLGGGTASAAPPVGRTPSAPRPADCGHPRPPGRARRGWDRCRSRCRDLCWHPFRNHLRSPGHPRLWFELLLIAFSYWLYSMVRNAVPEMRARAQRNAHDVWHFEQFLGIGRERAVNHAADAVTWLITAMDYYYATLHFIVTIGVLVWLFRKQPGRYAAARLSLFATTAVALLGYYFYPLAPPRLMDGGGFIDTVAKHHTWGSMASGDMADVSNQFAAMPSMHIGWSLWCGLIVTFLARRRWFRMLGPLYPVVTLVVIVASANHFFMDAVAGALCTGVGLLLSRLVYRRWVFAFPRDSATRPSLTPSHGRPPRSAPDRTPVGAVR